MKQVFYVQLACNDFGGHDPITKHELALRKPLLCMSSERAVQECKRIIAKYKAEGWTDSVSCSSVSYMLNHPRHLSILYIDIRLCEVLE